ncbi:hypothetical protein DL767_001124 [Monosporascus sp. MG133]|nr:hypothetical protein DL767_001124 [Monosporascus sp. MG133]
MHSAAWEMAQEEADFITAEDFMVLNPALFPAYQLQPDYVSSECDGPALLLPPDDILATVAAMMREYFGAFDSWGSIPASEFMRNLHKSLYVEVQDAFAAYAALPPAVRRMPVPTGRLRAYATPLRPGPGAIHGRPDISGGGGGRLLSRASRQSVGSATSNKGEGKGAGVESSRKRKTATADAGEDAVTPTKRSKGRKSIVKTEATMNDKEMDDEMKEAVPGASLRAYRTMAIAWSEIKAKVVIKLPSRPGIPRDILLAGLRFPRTTSCCERRGWERNEQYLKQLAKHHLHLPNVSSDALEAVMAVVALKNSDKSSRWTLAYNIQAFWLLPIRLSKRDYAKALRIAQ